MAYLLLGLMIVTFVCACVSLSAWFTAFTSGSKRGLAVYRIFGGITYNLLGFSGLFVQGLLEGTQAVYLPFLSVAFIALGVWLLRSGLRGG
jgi:hypothetical protein